MSKSLNYSYHMFKSFGKKNDQKSPFTYKGGGILPGLHRYEGMLSPPQKKTSRDLRTYMRWPIFLIGQFIEGKNFRPELPSLMKTDLVHVLSVVWATRSITQLRTPFEKRAHLCLLRRSGRECPWPIIDASCTIPSNSVGSWPLLFRWVVPSSST